MKRDVKNTELLATGKRAFQVFEDDEFSEKEVGGMKINERVKMRKRAVKRFIRNGGLYTCADFLLAL